MAQYGIYFNNNINTKKFYPYVIDVQSSLLDVLDTRIVFPVTNQETQGGGAITHLNPPITIAGKEFFIQTQQITAIHVNKLGPQIGDASSKRNEILASIDFLIRGF